MAVLDIRGTHGSGKSWIPHYLLENHINYPIEEEGHLIGYLIEDLQLVIIGKYETACGGCDGIKTADEVCRRVRMFHEKGYNVLLEGILVAHTYKRYAELAEEIGKDKYHFLFLNTPLKKCIWRVKGRRHSKGNKKPFNSKNLEHDYRQIWINLRPKLKENGFSVTEVPWRDPIPVVLRKLIEHADQD